MKVAQLLESRRKNWQALDQLCEQLQSRQRRKLSAEDIARFAALYRAACADLALADAYQLPPNTVQYLHRLVGRAHNQLYRSRTFDLGAWVQTLFIDTPRRIFNDRCMQFAFCFFWGIFILSAYLGYTKALWPNFAIEVIGEAGITQMETNFSLPLGNQSWELSIGAAAFYIAWNTTIGLQCFASSLAIIPGMIITAYNAVVLGASFGYMFRPDVPEGVNFREFVTAHGPFELTAIVLSFGAGLRIGFSWLITHGMTRTGSLRKAGSEAMPMMGAAIILFFLAAMIEGFISPSGLPYAFKATVAGTSSALLMVYFIVLGIPWKT